MSNSQSSKQVKPSVLPESSSTINEQVSHDIQVSHDKARQFKPEKLNPPRDFVLPSFVIDKSDDERPLVVEIGAGKGMHACLYAKQNPQHDLIAIERTQNKFTAFAGLVDSVVKEVVELDNLLAVHADAIPYCVYALPPKSVDMIYLLYPNPEPKNPNQQWLNMPFFEFLVSRLKANGKVVLASNITDYIDNAYEQALNTWHLPTQKSEIPKESRRTHFEIKYLARGEICWQLDIVKPEGYVTHFDNWISDELKASIK